MSFSAPDGKGRYEGHVPRRQINSYAKPYMKIIFKKIIVVLLRSEARLVLKKYRPKVVAITGSVGKTLTKDAIYSVLATTFFVRKSSKSFNSEIGVPLTILGLQNGWNNPFNWVKNLTDGLALILFPHKYPEWLVIEVGADRPGDIQSIASWLRPNIAVVTQLSDVPVHIEFFNSAEQVRHEKSQLVLATGKKDTVILNADDKLVSSMRPLAKGRVITYGSTNPADISGSDFNFIYSQKPPFFPTGVSFKVDGGAESADGKNVGTESTEVKGKKLPIEIKGALGRQQMYASLASLAVAEALHIPAEKAVSALCAHDSPPGRMRILSGVSGACIIDDTYNSSPVAANEALNTLKNVNILGSDQGLSRGADWSAGQYAGQSVGQGVGQSVGRKIVVLGDMLELGQYSQGEHEKLGIKAAGVADVIYTVGTRARGIMDSAITAGFPRERVFWFNDSTSAGDALRQNLKNGDIVLIKGSQGVRMEKAIAMILAEPERAGELLARQELEWRNR
mgnify:CR=1 FL=1